MKNLTIKRGLRCAIYTRVSTDQGLEQDFNSLLQTGEPWTPTTPSHRAPSIDQYP